MSSKFLAAAIIVGLCVAAAGGGAYLAVRQNAQAAPVAHDLTLPATPEREAAAVEADTSGGQPLEPVADDAPAQASPLAATLRQEPVPSPRPAAAPVGRTRANTLSAAPVTAPAPAPDPVAAPSAPSTLTDDALAAPPTPSPYIPSRPTIDTPPVVPTPAAETSQTTRGFEELQVPADAVIGVQIDRTISSDFARIEDRVDGRVTRDVRVAGQVAIPAGSKVRGSVTFAEQGGKFKTRARLGVRFHTILLADGSSVPIQTEAIFREGASPAGDARAKIGGGAVGGAIIGAILGGRKGAALGGSLGAGAGTAAVAASEPQPAVLPSGSTVTVRLSSSATVTIEKH